MKKALIVSNSAGLVTLFLKNDVELLLKNGYSVDVACNTDYPDTNTKDFFDRYCNKIFHIPFPIRKLDPKLIFESYTNIDVKGVELCGALKNIIALASGISAGLGYGDNAKAALITRGMAEITRLGLAMGCVDQTFAGLSGMGDLIVTATSIHSRNNRAGYLIGQGKKPDEAVKEVGMVVEGINALPAAMKLSKQYGVELPIISAVDAVINHNADPAKTVATLMQREKKTELTKSVLDMFMYFLQPHWVPATWRSRAQASIRAELPSGNVPTTRVRRRISRFSRSITLLVRMRVQCSLGKSQ